MSDEVKESVEQKETVQHFRYRAQPSGYAFPLDYPKTHIAEEFHVDPRTVNRYIGSNPLFSQFYHHMRYDGEYTERNHKKSEVLNGIPVELETFFMEFWDHASQHESKNAFVSPDLPKELENEFCKRLYQEALRAERNNDQENLYLYRRLYSNVAFQEVLLEEYWNEFQNRCELLKTLTRQLDAEAQMAKLRGILGMLDMEIAIQARRVAALEKLPEKDSSFLKTFPSEVLDDLRGRKVIYSDKLDEPAKFELPKLTVKASTPQKPHPKMLKDALDDAVDQKRDNEKLLNKTRKIYMSYIRTRNAKTTFQKQCEAFQLYLDDFMKPLDTETVKAEIEAVCKRFYGSIFTEEPISSGVYYDGFAEKRDAGEKQRFIIDEATYLYSQFSHVHGSFLGYLAPSSEAGDQANMFLRITSIMIQGGEPWPTDGRIFEQWASQHIKSVEHLWVQEYLGKFDLIQNSFDLNYESISEKIAMICQNTFELFGVEMPYWANCAYIRKGWQQYRKIVLKDKNAYCMAGFHYFDVILIRALFTCRLLFEFKKSCTLVLEHIQHLHKKLYEK